MGEQGIYFDHSHGTAPDLAHVPMILRAPGLSPQRRSELVSHVDVMPTFLDLAGIPIPPEARGLALGRYLRDGGTAPDRTLYCDIGDELSAYRGDRFARLENVSPVLLDVESIPSRANDAPGDDSKPWWASYEWRADGSWSLAEARDELPEDVRAYLRDKVRQTFNDDLSPRDVERLRALGYW